MKVTFGTVDVGYGLLIYFPKLCLATKWRPLGLKDFERDPTGDFATGVDYQGISDFNVTGFADCVNRLGRVAKDIPHGTRDFIRHRRDRISSHSVESPKRHRNEAQAGREERPTEKGFPDLGKLFGKDHLLSEKDHFWYS